MKELTSHIFKFNRILREKIQLQDSAICSPLQIKTLALVAEEKDRTMRSVADALYITSPSATSLISKLVDIGELTRHPDPKDRRIIRLRITAKGRHSLKKGQLFIEKQMQELFSILPEKDKQEFVRILEAVIGNDRNKSEYQSQHNKN